MHISPNVRVLRNEIALFGTGMPIIFNSFHSHQKLAQAPEFPSVIAICEKKQD
jgi:hypothetical protein